MKKALFYGVLGALFFAFTFIFNRSMNLGGGFWMWSACLRYLFTLPLMGLILLPKKEIRPVLLEISRAPLQWILWSTVGFGLFYAPLSAASLYGESWFVAATWQVTIVAGVLLTPLFGQQIPGRNLLCSVIILVGIFLLQVSHFGSGMKVTDLCICMGLILVGAFSYPLGNRKMMTIVPASFSTAQRVFGMTLCSIPFWLILSCVALYFGGVPSGSQVAQAFIVALFSGVIATLLFFEATKLVQHDPGKLAVIEATQSGEVLFTLAGGILFLGDAAPDGFGVAGIAVVVLGMVLNSLAGAGKKPREKSKK